jgi:hypothetical protein
MTGKRKGTGNAITIGMTPAVVNCCEYAVSLQG